jgi:hypothetical protein
MIAVNTAEKYFNNKKAIRETYRSCPQARQQSGFDFRPSTYLWRMRIFTKGIFLSGGGICEPPGHPMTNLY